MAKNEKKVVEQPQVEKPQITVVDSLECFGIVTDPKDSSKLRIVVGNHCASSIQFDSVTEAKAYIEKKPWELIMALAFEMAFNLQNSK